MKFSARPVFLCAAAALIVAGGAAQATIVTFVGHDPSPSGQVSGGALAARTQFNNTMIAGTIATEGFGGVSTGEYDKFTLAAIGATLSPVDGTYSPGRVVNTLTDGVEGRFDTSGDGQWWLSAVNFQIDFARNVSSFGFYGMDFGDFTGSLLMSVFLADGSKLDYDMREVMSPADSSTSGTLQFFGVVDDANSDQISSVRFSFTQAESDPDYWDYVGFDSFVVADVATPGNVPEPGSLALVGASLLALTAVRRRRQA